MSGAKENAPTANANGPAPSRNAGGGGGGGGGKASARSAGKTGSGAATPKASSGPQKRKKEPAPYEPDSKVWTVFVRDNTLREAVVLARDLLHKPEGYSKKTCTVKDPSKFRYYVHYADFNRRMDEWIPFENFREEDGSLPRVVMQEEAPDSGGRSPASDAGGGDGGGGGGGSSGAPATKKGRMSPVGGRAAAAAPTVAPVAAADLQVVKKNDNVGEFIEELTTDAMDEESLKEHDELTKVKNVGELEIGRYRIDTWYFSPYPKEVIPDAFLPTLFLCEFCLDFFSRRDNMLRHTKKCMSGRHPPGDEIYRHEGIAFFEIDGSKARIYCQNLCYLAKLFLDHKTLYYDVDPFMFYVMCEYDSRGYHITGYFSKEKYSEQGYNLACILTLPCYQRRGYGNFLIQFSYALSKKERRMGSPEKPLSDLGQLSYNSYWSSEILNVLKHNYGRSLSIVDIAMATAFDIEDIQHTLNLLGLLKYSHGAHILHVEPSLVERKCKLKPGRKKLDPTKLHWFPIRESMKRDRFSFDTLLAGNFD